MIRLPMFAGAKRTDARIAELEGALEAIGKSQAMIEFGTDGTILGANELFLATMGYNLDDIRGRHHRIFVDTVHSTSPEYRAFWEALRRGEYQSGEYRRLGKGGRERWIQASYNPILGMDSKPTKIIKIATDITEQKRRNVDYAGQIAAIGKSQAVISFDTDGIIVDANHNFLSALGYELNEIMGRHHRLFVTAEYAATQEYVRFWSDLRTGHYQTGEFCRINKGGREVWIQASYNPILDADGRVLKIVKYASDVTKQVMARKKSEHLNSVLQGVAAGAEEMNASVKEIAIAMVRSKETAGETVARVDQADGATQKLNQAATALGGIASTIEAIADRINLLALNATIEAARAGGAGKGFAVVATEIKSLANQARIATDQIAGQIGSMNVIFGDVVGGLSSIKSSITRVHEYVVSTAAAVEEQSAVANEMSSSMQRAAVEAARM